MRTFVICLMTVGLVVLPAKPKADGGDQQSSGVAEGNTNPAHDAKANRPSNEVAPSKSKDASREVEIQQLRDLVQYQAGKLESQYATPHKAIPEQQQEIEQCREELQVSRSASATMAAPRASALITRISGSTSTPAVEPSAKPKPAPPSSIRIGSVDPNLQVSLPWTPARNFASCSTPMKRWAVGLAIENHDRIIGGAVALPSALTTSYSG